MPKVLNSSMSSTVIMNEEAERILSKPVIKKKRTFYSPYVAKNCTFGKDGKNLINLKFVLMYMLG